ncbi:MAG: hypothetical protein ACLTEH_04035 [Clostridia bacterium]
MKKIVIRQTSHRQFHLLSTHQLESLLARQKFLPTFRVKSKGSNGFSILLDKHISEVECILLAKELGLQIISLSDARAIFSFDL